MFNLMLNQRKCGNDTVVLGNQHSLRRNFELPTGDGGRNYVAIFRVPQKAKWISHDRSGFSQGLGNHMMLKGVSTYNFFNSD